MFTRNSKRNPASPLLCPTPDSHKFFVCPTTTENKYKKQVGSPCPTLPHLVQLFSHQRSVSWLSTRWKKSLVAGLNVMMTIWQSRCDPETRPSIQWRGTGIGWTAFICKLPVISYYIMTSYDIILYNILIIWQIYNITIKSPYDIIWYVLYNMISYDTC